MFILSSKEDSPLKSVELSLQRTEYDEILNRILRFCDYSRISGITHVHLLSARENHVTGAGELTTYAPSVSNFLIDELIRKIRPFQANGTDASLRACYESWIASEQQCKNTNERFLAEDFNSAEMAILKIARKLVKRVLGSLDIDEIFEYSGPGPGSSFGSTRNKTGQYYKYLDKENFHITWRGEKFLPGLIWGDDLWVRALGQTNRSSLSEYLEWSSLNIRIIPGNRLTTVPKTSKTDRPISIEPGLLLMLQKGAGSAIRRKLRRAGIDLDHQAEYHGEAVKLFWSEIATVDLSSASDTISEALVEALLPGNWFQFLDDIRSPATRLPHGVWYRTQKFSSMGNGFTFELETLIFWAISSAVVIANRKRGLKQLSSESLRHANFHRLHVSVFGDDIICHKSDFEQICRWLQTFGFTVNSSKSFSGERAFKESCGVNTLYGYRLPVFNLKRLDTWMDVFVLVNSLLRQVLHLRKIGLYRYAFQVEGLRSEVLRLIPDKFRLVGPRTEIMDSYIHSMNVVLAPQSNLHRLQRKLRRRQIYLIDDGTGDVRCSYRRAEAAKQRPSSLIELDLSQRYYIFPLVSVSTQVDPGTESDYFGQAIYSLRNRRFQGGMRRGQYTMHRRLTIVSHDECEAFTRR